MSDRYVFGDFFAPLRNIRNMYQLRYTYVTRYKYKKITLVALKTSVEISCGYTYCIYSILAFYIYIYIYIYIYLILLEKTSVSSTT